LRPVLRALKEGLSFHYSPDEDFGAARSVFVDFFAAPTATLPILGRLARSANALVVPCMTRLTDKGYEVKFWPALTNYPTGDEMMDAARMNAAMEAGLREMPEQYMWTFKIFKTRPGGAPSPYG
jgi:lauroyl/myristoyl acyltransferase